MIVQLAFDGTAPTTSIREVVDRKFSGKTATQVVSALLRTIEDGIESSIADDRSGPQRGAQFVVESSSLPLKIVVDPISVRLLIDRLSGPGIEVSLGKGIQQRSIGRCYATARRVVFPLLGHPKYLA